MIALLVVVVAPARAETLVRMQISVGNAAIGDIDILLSDSVAPATVANFLVYMNRRDYDETFWHASSVAPLAIRGGGYWPLTTSSLPPGNLFPIPREPAIANEFSLPNLRGAVAMDKLAGDPNSATSEFLINLADNPDLDTTNGGYTVFGQVDPNSLPVVDAIGAYMRWNFSLVHGSVFNEIPLADYPGGGHIDFANLIRIRRTVLVADNQCGDANDDLVVDDADLSFYRQHLADPGGAPLGAGGAAKCSVIGSTSDCDIVDVVVMARDLAFEQPRIASVCAAAGP